jgi:molybdopterin-binding protein
VNALRARVESIHSDEYFSVVLIRIKEVGLKLLKTELPRWLEVGDEVECRIQEASVAICKGAHGGEVSIENHIEAKVNAFRKGEVLSEVTLDTPCGKVVSLITTEAMERMHIEKGSGVTMLLKAVDIKLMPTLATSGSGSK